MSSFKKLNKADITTVPYAANKQWNLSFYCFPTSSEYLTIYKGTNLTSSFSLTSDPVSEGQYERLIYASINHLFYQSYTGSLDTGSLMFNTTTYESASQQRPTASYFDYNTNPLLIKNFPTGANESIRVLVINQDIYGSKVLPHSFVLTSSAYSVTDDGNGNLFDTGSINGYVHIGNIFYAHGIGVITNQDYQPMFPSSSAACGTTTTTTTTSTTSTTTTSAPTTTTSTTSTTTTSSPTTTTTTTTTTAAPTTTTSTTTTTTTAAPAEFDLGYATTTGNDACSDFSSSPTTYYASPGSTFTAGTVLYTDSALTILAPDDYYSDGTTWYLITGGNGTLTGGTACAATTTTTTTTTSTTTTTTTAVYTVEFYGRLGDTTSDVANIFYSLDNSTWNPVITGPATASIDSTSCVSRGTISVSAGSTVYVSLRDSVFDNTIYYNAQTGTTCPSNSQTYCETAGTFSTTINATTDIAITAYVNGGIFVTCV